MKIALCSSFVPFVHGGARNIVDWLEPKLREAGHEVEVVYLPQVDAPHLLLRQMAAYRRIELDAADRIICFRPQAHLIPHRHKILWFIHHVRIFYDLWDTPYRAFPDNARTRRIRDKVRAEDTRALREAKTIFTNSNVVSARLKSFNQIDSQVLYPPIFQPERFHCRSANDEILCISRLEHHKRQHLLIEAMAHTREPVRLRLCGASAGPDYPGELRQRIAALGLQERVVLEDRWISEEEKADLLADCLAVAYLPLNEDSYGYFSAEASHASKAILTTTDSGGVLELVQDGLNGYVTEPSPPALAAAMDQLARDRNATRRLGENARARLDQMEISWSHVLQQLLA